MREATRETMTPLRAYRRQMMDGYRHLLEMQERVDRLRLEGTNVVIFLNNAVTNKELPSSQTNAQSQEAKSQPRSAEEQIEATKKATSSSTPPEPEAPIIGLPKNDGGPQLGLPGTEPFILEKTRQAMRAKTMDQDPVLKRAADVLDRRREEKIRANPDNPNNIWELLPSSEPEPDLDPGTNGSPLI